MNWTSTRVSRVATPPAPPQPQRPETHRSLALRALLDELPEDRSSRVLDLGSASGRNVDFLSQYACKIQIEDLYTSLPILPVLPVVDGEVPEAPPFERVLGFDSAAQFDVILVWDLLDYLDRESIRALVSYLARFCRPNSLLLAFSSTQKEIAEHPVRFRFVDGDTLEYEVDSPHKRTGPRYTPRDLTHMFAGFRVQQSFLLKNGIQEYLFARE